jgi:hypothetical protein
VTYSSLPNFRLSTISCSPGTSFTCEKGQYVGKVVWLRPSYLPGTIVEEELDVLDRIVQPLQSSSLLVTEFFLKFRDELNVSY